MKALKLPTVLAECKKGAAENVDHLGFLLRLVELELFERERKAVERCTSGELPSCGAW